MLHIPFGPTVKLCFKILGKFFGLDKFFQSGINSQVYNKEIGKSNLSIEIDVIVGRNHIYKECETINNIIVKNEKAKNQKNCCLK